MKIAITGGTGFVGGHLARSLVRKGHRVVLIARGCDRRGLKIRKLENSQLACIGLGESVCSEKRLPGVRLSPTAPASIARSVARAINAFTSKGRKTWSPPPSKPASRRFCR